MKSTEALPMKQQCRLCGAGLSDVLDLGMFAPSDFVSEQINDSKVPLILAQCTDCELIQLRHTIDRDKLYRTYWYLSGLNPSMIESLRDIVRGVENRVSIQPGDTVIDVGANDGTLLTLYKEKVNKIGFDPARNLAEQAQQVCDMFVNDFFETSRIEVPKAKVVTSIAMFYALDEPRRFVQRVVNVLDREGLWVMQMTDLVRMLQANAFDNICHEHLCYYSLKVFKELVEKFGLEIVDVDFNDVNGGSLRAYVGFAGVRSPQPTVVDALQEEALILRSNVVEQFSNRVAGAKERVVTFIHKERREGKRFHVLGASTKGNTLLQYFGLSNKEIECAAEVNASKYGLRTAGSNIPIVSQEESLAMNPDYYLVLPWHFIEFFRRHFANYMFVGGALLTPLPVPMLHQAHAFHL